MTACANRSIVTPGPRNAMTQPDFLDSHERHLTDAELLFGRARYANADHLFGLSAECGLKRLMEVFGMNLEPDGRPPDRDRRHINQLRPRFDAYRSGHPLGTQYGLAPNDPFSDWVVDQRYEHQGRYTKALVESHQKGAQDIAALIHSARLGGIL